MIGRKYNEVNHDQSDSADSTDEEYRDRESTLVEIIVCNGRNASNVETKKWWYILNLKVIQVDKWKLSKRLIQVLMTIYCPQNISCSWSQMPQ